MENMENAAGSADAEMSIIENSLEYKINALKETWTGTFQSMIDRGTLGDAVDDLTTLSEVVGFLAENFLSLKTVIAGIGITAFVKNFTWLIRATKINKLAYSF